MPDRGRTPPQTRASHDAGEASPDAGEAGLDGALESEIDDGSTVAASAGRILGPLLACAALGLTHPEVLGLGGLGGDASWTLALLTLMAVWWVTLAVEPAVTGLIPFVALAILGIGKPAEIAAPYANDVIFLFAGGAVDLGLDGLGVLGRAVLLEKFDHGHDFFVGDESALRAHQTGTAGRREEHVAAADKGIGALGVEDGAGVDLGGDLEGDP